MEAGNPLGITEITTQQAEAYLAEFREVQLLYQSALREISTKLEILNDEFTSRGMPNPIEHIKSRIKTPQSVLSKLSRRGMPLTMQSARENLNDIAGIRVICSFIDDIYTVAKLLTGQNDVTLIRWTDYIASPKPNGYRSLHLVVEIPVFFSTGAERIRVEVQIRTVAMDFWASLEHKLRYKHQERQIPGMAEDLLSCAKIISALDEKMADINRRILALGAGDGEESS